MRPTNPIRTPRSAAATAALGVALAAELAATGVLALGAAAVTVGDLLVAAVLVVGIVAAGGAAVAVTIAGFGWGRARQRPADEHAFRAVAALVPTDKLIAWSSARRDPDGIEGTLILGEDELRFVPDDGGCAWWLERSRVERVGALRGGLWATGIEVRGDGAVERFAVADPAGWVRALGGEP